MYININLTLSLIYQAQLNLDTHCKPTLICHDTLFRDLPEKHWLTASNFCDQDVDYIENKLFEAFEDWFAVRNVCATIKALMKISREHT